MAQVEVDLAKLEPHSEPNEEMIPDSGPEPSDEKPPPESPAIEKKKQKRYYIPTGRPRGRPRKDASELARPRPGTRPRGRPRKSDSASSSVPCSSVGKSKSQSQRKLREILPKPASQPVPIAHPVRVIQPVPLAPPVANESIIGSVSMVKDCSCDDPDEEKVFVIPPPIAVIPPRGRPRGRPKTISRNVAVDPPRALLPKPTESPSTFIPADPPVKRGRGRPRIHPRPPPGTPRRGRGRPRIHHRPEDIIIKDLSLEEELDRLQSLVMKKDTIIKRLKRQLTRLQEADDEHLMRVKLEMNAEKEGVVSSSEEDKAPSGSES
ncbi:hypothetical protein CAPTEDRAFT_220052 [Capitella teleta]|uniref:Uncharacterized protein n=1 Tax=Capitella teleta TaxID=283909 RepID=R7VGY9_CAPTE|nr:hypothetical protein CAPTEDRAFT_220052 [Capitella teleta]|eukprot:ELU14960.1 hypothetical protein CAPTEDRAFT_220052 [Capitella teleta]